MALVSTVQNCVLNKSNLHVQNWIYKNSLFETEIVIVLFVHSIIIFYVNYKIL